MNLDEAKAYLADKDRYVLKDAESGQSECDWMDGGHTVAIGFFGGSYTVTLRTGEQFVGKDACALQFVGPLAKQESNS